MQATQEQSAENCTTFGSHIQTSLETAASQGHAQIEF